MLNFISYIVSIILSVLGELFAQLILCIISSVMSILILINIPLTLIVTVISLPITSILYWTRFQEDIIKFYYWLIKDFCGTPQYLFDCMMNMIGIKRHE